ncbi:hypothetical protein OFO03_05595 [Campylobacter sp. JMF_02 ED1]|uniref:hypothetical protein n=1 Tax=unclassified Campylobacter TaxID=2593542 RepID=UPI0022E9BBB8|nr:MULTISPECIES: hypothetical protein [unclassified Campylobacter]MDA3049209.1 hypothetical protein [Campylobacter sp. JMF_15 NE4]MDA3051366.1 hypothetical protein [Campylobacter sp. JMF_02 ED1]
MILENEKFIQKEIAHIKEILELFFELGESFGVVARTSEVKFDPELPSEISAGFIKKPVIFFELENYTLSSAHIQKDDLKFEAGFGSEDFAAVVSIPLYAIMEIVQNNTPVAVNLAKIDSEWIKKERSRRIFAR